MNARTFRLLGVLAALLILPLASRAGYLVQGGALQIVPGHASSWVYNGILGDAGGSANPQITDFGISSPGMPFCINDVSPPPGDSPPTGAFHQFCLGATATIGGHTGGFLSYNGYGGAAAQSLYADINGTIYPFPFAVSGIVGPVSTTVPDAATWANTNGTLLGDLGSPPLLAQPTVAALKAMSLTAIGAGQIVSVLAYSTPGDLPSAVSYQLVHASCTLGAGVGDGGSQLPSTTSGWCWYLNPPPGNVIYARVFGCKLDGTTDDTICFANATAYLATLSTGAAAAYNGKPVLTCGGAFLFVSATDVVQNLAGGNIEHCGFKLNPAVSWPSAQPNGAIYVDTANGDYAVTLAYNSCDGGALTNPANAGSCFTVIGHSATDQVLYNTGVHLGPFFMRTDGVLAIGNEARQWAATDPPITVGGVTSPPYCTRSLYTSVGIWADWTSGSVGDGQYSNNTMHNMLYPIEIGDPSNASTEDIWTADHPYNGESSTGGCTRSAVGNTHTTTTVDGFTTNVKTYGWSVGDYISGTGIPGNDTIAAIASNGLSLTLKNAATSTNTALTIATAVNNPTDILINTGSGGHSFVQTLLDHGQVILNETNANRFIATRFTSGTDTNLTSWFVANAESANDSWQGEVEPPVGLTVGAGSGVCLIAFDATGGSSWTGIPPNLDCNTASAPVPASMVSGITENGRALFITNPSSPNAFSLNCAANNCGIEFQSSGVGATIPSQIYQDNGNDIEFAANNTVPFALNSNDHVSFLGLTPTCTGGCGTGYSLSGSKQSGNVTLGTSPSTTVVLDATAGATEPAWSTQPNCSVTEYTNAGGTLADITGFLATTTTYTFTLATGGAGRVLHWSCSVGS